MTSIRPSRPSLVRRHPLLILLLVAGCGDGGGSSSSSRSGGGCSNFNQDAAGERNEGSCPEGETCSPRTPDGLVFIGPDITGVDGLENLLSGHSPHAVVRGGTEPIALFYEDGTTPFHQLAVADSPDGLLLASALDFMGRLSITGARDGTDYLEIREPSGVLHEPGPLFDRILVRSAPIAFVRLAPANWSTPDEASVVFFQGFGNVVLALAASDGERLVDTSATVDGVRGPESAGWDQFAIDTSEVGAHSVTVTAGDGVSQALTVEVVDHIDSLTARAEHDDFFDRVCFDARLGSRIVAGAPIELTIAGEPAQRAFDRENCAYVATGTTTVVGTSGGLSRTITVVVPED